MERHVKERLIGAAVLMAAAIILIPEMLSGPRRNGEPVATTRATPEGAVKTYTIDLSRSPDADAAAKMEEQAPPPEEVTPAPQLPEPAQEPQSTAPLLQENPAKMHQGSDESTSGREAKPPSQAPVAPPSSTTRTPVVAVRDTPPPIASGAPVPTSRGWAVQLGSFASRATADRMAQENSVRGQKAFVMPVKSGDTTLYRVRIGPFAERAEANEVLRDVKGHVANAAVVAHP